MKEIEVKKIELSKMVSSDDGGFTLRRKMNIELEYNPDMPVIFDAEDNLSYKRDTCDQIGEKVSEALKLKYKY